MKRILTLLLVVIMTLTSLPAYCESGTWTSFSTTPWQEETLRGNLDSVYVDGHFYSTDVGFDEAEEVDTFCFKVDGEVKFNIDTDTSPRGIARIGSTVYVALVDGIFKYSDGEPDNVVNFPKGVYIYGIVSNNKDLYVYTGSDRYKVDGMAGFKASFYKVTPSGTITTIKGTDFFEYYTNGIAVNSSGDRIAYIPYMDTGTIIKRSDGSEYDQRIQDTFDFNGDFFPNAILYYKDCLIVNDHNTLYIYDITYDKNGKEINHRQQVLRSDINVGEIFSWNIGTDGNVYGWTSINYETYSFKWVVPDKIKTVVSYKKKK